MHENSLKNLQKFQPGQSGNPNGRPTARSRLTELADVSHTWEQHGSQILQGMAKKEPVKFADLCSRLIPRDMEVTLRQQLPGGLDQQDWQLVTEVMSAVKQAIPDAGARSPGAVMQHVLDALRAHDAKVIEPSTDVANALPNIALPEK
jgi:hypothetical protein